MKRTGAANNGDGSEPFGNMPRASQGIRAATRHACDAEAIQAERIGELTDVFGPIEQCAAFFKVGAAEAGPVNGNEPRVKAPRRRFGEARLQPRSEEHTPELQS